MATARHITPIPLLLVLSASGCDPSDSSLLEECAAAPPPELEARLAGMRAALGCEPSRTPVADPPGGCEGAKLLIDDVRAHYVDLWQEGGCNGSAPDLTAHAESYAREFAARHAFRRHRIERDGMVIDAREFGAQHAGPMVVLMHGFPDNQHLYDRLAPELARTLRTITFDFIGWGDSTIPPPGYAFTFEGLRKDLDAVLAHFGASEIVPVVHDASGWPGIDWALDHPDTVKSLVLLNTAYHPIEAAAPPNAIRALSALDLRPRFLEALGDDALMTRALFRAQVGRFFTSGAQRDRYLPVLEHHIERARPGLIGLTASLLDNVIAHAASVPRMQRFDRPVTIAFGEDDPYLNPGVAQAFAEVFPQARLALIARGGHYVQLDRPDEVAALVREAAAPAVDAPNARK